MLAYLFRFTYNSFLPFLSVISFFHPSIYSHVLSLSYFLALPLAATSFYSGFPPENISASVPKTELPAFPILLSNHLPRRLPTLLMKLRRYYVDITRMPRCVQCIHEPYARILNRLPQHSAQAKLL